MAKSKLNFKEYAVISIPLSKEKSIPIFHKAKSQIFRLDSEQVNRIVNEPTNFSGNFEKMRSFVIGSMSRLRPIKYVVISLRTRKILCTKMTHCDSTVTEVIKFLLGTMTSHFLMTS